METNYRDNPINWSLSLGRWAGIFVRVHLLFFLWMAYTLYQNAVMGQFIVGLIISSMVFVVIVLHEFGHCFGARSVGGQATDVLMWPLGGLATVDAPQTPRAQCITTAAGPAVNIVFCALCGTLLILMAGFSGSVPLNPFRLFGVPVDVSRWSLRDVVIVVWSVNYTILLFNLVPMFPMDGGRLLQVVLWKRVGFYRATLVATFVGMAGAIGLGLLGLISEQFLLIGIAIFGYLTCMQHRQALKSGLLTPDAEMGYGLTYNQHPWLETTSDADTKKSSWWSRRREASRLRRSAKRRQNQEELEKQIDVILDKVHRQGIQSLTRTEKRILQRASKTRKSIE